MRNLLNINIRYGSDVPVPMTPMTLYKHRITPDYGTIKKSI